MLMFLFFRTLGIGSFSTTPQKLSKPKVGKTVIKMLIYRQYE